VRNPQNVGAVLRSAAFFGVKAVILGAPAPHPGLPPFALRVAEGGAEHLAFCRTTDLADTLGRLRGEGIPVLGADAHAQGSLATIDDSPTCVLVLGHEREGLGPRVKAQCSALVSIQGSGALDSLNVAVAAGVLLAELWRRSSAGVRGAPRSPGAVEHRR
jgi:TrmH RNA methyltransferase